MLTPSGHRVNAGKDPLPRTAGPNPMAYLPVAEPVCHGLATRHYVALAFEHFREPFRELNVISHADTVTLGADIPPVTVGGGTVAIPGTRGQRHRCPRVRCATVPLATGFGEGDGTVAHAALRTRRW